MSLFHMILIDSHTLPLFYKLENAVAVEVCSSATMFTWLLELP